MADAALLGTSFTRGSSTSTPVDISAVPVGKWMVISLMTSLSTATFTAPAGWEVLKAIETTGTRRNQMWGRVKELGDGNTATFTSSASSSQTFAVMWGDGDWANKVIGASRVRSTVGASPRSQNIAPTVTAGAGSLILALTHEATNGQVATDEITAVSPSGWTRSRWVEQISGFIETIGIYSKILASAGASGDVTFTYSSTQDTNGWAVQLAIPAVAAPAPPRRGFASVAEMLARFGATWAHRGGSAFWPEMSEYAYDQAVLAGYGALEFSAHRTSDGVWVGSHDPSLNRTSETTGLPAISTMTWAQVQTHMNSLNGAGTPRPYYRLDAFLDKFTPTHVCIVDPKSDVGLITEFLDLCDAHGGNKKIVVKYFGTGSGSTALADAAKDRGYQTWGYFYQAGFEDGSMDRDQSHWSILGMDYTASQAAWDAVTSYGKPVTGHIIQNQASYNTAITKGATMAQVAAVGSVAAVGALWGGIAEGLFTFGGSATGRKPSGGTAAGSYSVAGSATGKKSPAGSAAGSTEFAGSAAGSRASRGAAGGSFAFSGTASGGTVPTGQASGSWAAAGSAAGKVDPQGEGEGLYQFAGTAEGAKRPRGQASGTVLWAGSATGVEPSLEDAAGTAAGSYLFTGSGAGERPSRGSGAGSFTVAGSAVGKIALSGAAAGAYVFEGSAVGSIPGNGSSLPSRLYSELLTHELKVANITTELKVEVL